MKRFIKLIGAAIAHKASKGFPSKLVVLNYEYFDTMKWLADHNVTIRIRHSPFKRGEYYYCELEYNGDKVVCERIERCKATAKIKWSL